MLTLSEAQEKLLAMPTTMPIVHVASTDALGRILAEPLVARRTQPAADLSAMDGYAIAGDGPWTITGESRCGAPFSAVIEQGQAARISTGAWMPEGTDRVLIQENAARDGASLSLTGDMPQAGRHIRRAGFDFAEGQALLPAGTAIGPAQLALAMAAGHGTIPVRERPAVAVIDCGDELSADPENCLDNQIPATNGPMLAAMIAGLATTRRSGPVGDDRDALRAAFASAEDCEVIVTSGGASVGDHDLVRPVLESMGADIALWRVAIKPGKPLMIARLGHTIVVGLPGNPVSSFVTANLFLLPLLRAMAGYGDPLPRPVPARLGAPLEPTGKRMEFIRAAWSDGVVTPLAEQDSSALATLARANALIWRDADQRAAEPGADVRALLVSAPIA